MEEGANLVSVGPQKDKLTNIGKSTYSMLFGFFFGIHVTFVFLFEHVEIVLFSSWQWENWWTYATDCASFVLLCRFDTVLFWPAMFSLVPNRLKLFVCKTHCNSLNPAALQDMG